MINQGVGFGTLQMLNYINHYSWRTSSTSACSAWQCSQEVAIILK